MTEISLIVTLNKQFNSTQLKVYTLIIAYSRNYDFSQQSLTRARAEQRITESAQKYRIGRGMTESAQLL